MTNLTAEQRERVSKLADALESGEYERGKGFLCRITEDGRRQWCCLGVACDVARKNGLDLSEQNLGNYLSFDGKSACLPSSVMQWYGFDTSNPSVQLASYVSVPSLAGYIEAADANDNGATFAELAQGFRDMYVNDNSTTSVG